MKLAAIFDVDGVLVDSYDAHFQSWRQLGAETGIQINQREFASTFGRTSRDIIARFWPVSAADRREIEALDRRKEQIYRDLVSAEFPVMDGASALIEDLHRHGFAVAIGSSGPPENVHLAIERLGVRSLIDAAVTGKDVTRGKPDPEVFLTAAMRLRTAPEACVVIEDAPAGIVAAHAGGMRAIALLSRGHAQQDFADHPADFFVQTLRELNPSILANIIRRQP